MTLQSNQHLELDDIATKISAVKTPVTAAFADQVVLEQVKCEETQRILGIIPNFQHELNQLLSSLLSSAQAHFRRPNVEAPMSKKSKLGSVCDLNV